MTTAVEELNKEVEKSLETNIVVEIKKEVMQNILKRLDRSREKKGVLPIRQGIYLYFTGEKITGIAMNANYTTKVEIHKDKDNYNLIEGEEGGAVFMDAKFISMVNSLPRKTIKISINGKEAMLSAGRSRFEVKILDHSEYPTIFNEVEGEKITLPGDVLKHLYQKTVHATSSLETRPALTGINHKIDSEHLVLTATDAHRLATIRHKIDEDISDVSHVIPSGTVNEITKLLDDTVSNVNIYFKENQVTYEFSNGVTLFSRVISDNYPATDKLIPDGCSTELIFTVSEIQSLIKRSLLVDQEHPIKVLIKPEDRQVRFLSREADKSGFEEDIVPNESNGDDIKLGFNVRYLLDALSHHDPSEQIRIQFISNIRPFVLKTKNGDQFNLDLILPVRLSEETTPGVVIENFTADMQMEMVEEETDDEKNKES